MNMEASGDREVSPYPDCYIGSPEPQGDGLRSRLLCFCGGLQLSSTYF